MDEENLARLACSACRKQKRKCSRELPSCQLCRKNRRQCQYPEGPPSNYDDDDMIASAPQGTFLPLFFLDSYTFGHRRSVVELPAVNLPREFLDLVDSDREETLDLYFNTTHQCFPIISKRRLYQQPTFGTSPKADTLLLLICMKLLTSRDEELYDKAKRCYQFVEGRGLISVRSLQAALLLSLYETANAIYPAAFLSVGHCARIGQAMGIHDRKNAPQMFPTPMSWTETEELRRVWWGVIVLDRFVSLGVQRRPFSCQDARPEDLLPMDEALWDLGEQTVIPSLAVSASAEVAAPPFARTCQASHLVSRVLAHINSSPDAGTSSLADHYSQSMQLHRILTSFHAALEHDLETAPDQLAFMALAPAMGICLSGMIALCDAHTCADLDDPSGVGIPEQLQMQKLALTSLHDICGSACGFASRLGVAATSGLGTRALLSPLVAEALFSSAKQFLWYIRETGKLELLASVEVLTGALRLVGQRWRVANEYLTILEGDEFRPLS